jgi:hypothetical protein
MTTVICQYNMQINQRHYLYHFLICQETNGVSKESRCADNMNLWTAENCKSSYQIHVTEVVKDMCDNFCKVFGQGWVFTF